MMFPGTSDLPDAVRDTMIIASEFTPPAWARSPHLQTLWGPMVRRDPPPPRREERLELSDGDHLWLHWAGPEPKKAEPRILILHGLSGCADSHYARGLQRVLAEQGRPSVVMNARGAAGRPNDTANTYHAGETGDVADVIDHLRTLDADAPIMPVGFSLGGSRLLNWLAEGGSDAVPAALAVSVPLRLDLCSERLDRGLSRIYRNHLIRQLLGQQQVKQEHLRRVAPEEGERLGRLGGFSGIRTFTDFDNRIVAPLHGFEDAADYYRRCSAGPRLARINTPTLLIQSGDDPFMTPGVLPSEEQLGEQVTLELSRHGGHVGFVAGSPLRPRYWLEARIPAFLRRWP